MIKRRKTFVWVLMLLVFVAGCGGTGDRVLVSKCYYDGTPWDPARHDVVVFRFPEQPIKGGSPTNYIKRLIGLAGETIAIFMGQLFVITSITHPEDEKADPKIRWGREFMHQNEAQAVELFRKGKFKIVRKDPATILAMRRIVYDNDFHAQDLKGVLPPRWNPKPADNWKADSQNKDFSHEGQGKDVDWLRYQHILRPPDWPNKLNLTKYNEVVAEITKRKHEPQLITDFSGYNSYESNSHPNHPPLNWVGDLMLDLEVTVKKPQGEFRIELARGVDRFQARWDLGNKVCSLVRLQDGVKDEEVLVSKPSDVSQPGSYRIRFANVDQRLTVWVNRALVFGNGQAYKSPYHYDAKYDKWVNTGPTANDLQPVSVGSKGAAVQVSHLSIWRDTYYTNPNNGRFHNVDYWSDPKQWDNLRDRPELTTMFVQPGHYLCMGDNSPESYDSRMWGLVPQRLLLGRALMVYWPSSRLGTIIH